MTVRAAVSSRIGGAKNGDGRGRGHVHRLLRRFPVVRNIEADVFARELDGLGFDHRQSGEQQGKGEQGSHAILDRPCPKFPQPPSKEFAAPAGSGGGRGWAQEAVSRDEKKQTPGGGAQGAGAPACRSAAS